jgi:hypothetical protein
VLVVRKLQLENRIRQIKDQIRDARDRGVPIDDVLVRERDEVNTALHEVAVALMELRATRSSEVSGFKSAFLKQAKRMLPKATYTEIALAAVDFIHTRQGQASEEEER